MKVEYINPFVQAVDEFFISMLSTAVERGKISVLQKDRIPAELTAIIGMTGQMSGTVALGLPNATALAIVNKLLGTENKVMDETVSDGVAECVNIIAGTAKSRLPISGDKPIELTIPTVVRGYDYQTDHPSKSVWLEVPFTGALGVFNLRVTLREK